MESRSSIPPSLRKDSAGSKLNIPGQVKIRTQTPTRADLAGGTLDIWPIAHILAATEAAGSPLAKTINVALAYFTRVQMYLHFQDAPQTHPKVILNDGRKSKEWRQTLDWQDMHLNFPLATAVLRFFLPQLATEGCQQITIETQSDVPRGSGLGGSSSLLVGLVSAFSKVLGKTPSPMEVSQIACNIEAGLLGTLAGSQDHLAAAFGGTSSFTFHPEGVQHRPLPRSFKSWMEEHSMLVLAPEEHHSGKANWNLVRSILERNDEALTVFREVAENARTLESALAEERFADIPILASRDWKMRKAAFPQLSTQNIDALESLAEQAHAVGFKVCGAAEGGMALVFADPNFATKATLIEKFQSAGYQTFPVTVNEGGCRLEYEHDPSN